jgi:predicted nucleic acid-binding protein
MPGRVFLDTIVLVYALSDVDDPKRSVARELLADRTATISTQVLLETTNVLVRKLGARVGDAARVLRNVPFGLVVSDTPEIVEEAWRVSDRYGLGIYDAAIVAAAASARCTVLYTEDLQHDQKFGSLMVRNPFL